MNDKNITEEYIKKAWHTYLTTGDLLEDFNAAWFEHKAYRPLIRLLPASPRCDICYIPFEGFGGKLFKGFYNVERSKLNPRLCNLCENFATHYHGGTELEISMLFVDVRGSTSLAENTTPQKYGQLISRFYRAATEELYRGYGFVEKLIGDEVAGFFVPGFAGPNHAKTAVNTGKRILKAMGYGSSADPWIPVGVGIHTGVAYVGSVTGYGGFTDISMLGDAVNTAARITSHANAGELILSESALLASGLKTDGMESRSLQLKGKSEEVQTWVLNVGK